MMMKKQKTTPTAAAAIRKNKKNNLELPIETVRLASLKPDPSNPNRMSREQKKGLNQSLKTLKNFKLLVVDQNNVIIDGHQRWEELRNLGIEETQVIRYKVKDKAERILVRQLANKLYGQHDPALDVKDFQALLQNERLSELATMLAKPQDDFLFLMEQHAKFVPQQVAAIDGNLKDENGEGKKTKCPACGHEW